MPKHKYDRTTKLEKLSIKVTDWMGTPQSIIVHTLLFALSFVLILFGINMEVVLLGLTTAVSLEAIYLALFIQMTVNRHSRSLKEVAKDIDEIQEDVEDVSEDIQDVTEDIQEDDLAEMNTSNSLKTIEIQMKNLAENLNKINEEIIALHKKTG